ncbi:MAG: lamin tail domain-containing protein [Saprospirales bacterium]|nr:lamin tail domain-containing protein [Saprospirales bacterium]
MYFKHILLSLACALSVYMAQAQTYGDGLVINEFVAANDSLSGIADPNGQFEDWIELYNGGNLALNLENFALSDKPDNPLKWLFPAGTTLEPDGYLIIWADEDQSQEGLHANFKLSKGGEFLMLSNPFGEVLDSLTFGPQETNIAYARRPNGTGNFIMQNSTFGYNNDEVNSTVQRLFPQPLFTLSPNPATTEVVIGWTTEEAPSVLAIDILNLTGQVLWRGVGGSYTSFRIPVEGITPGIYHVRIQTDKGIWVQPLTVTR